MRHMFLYIYVHTYLVDMFNFKMLPLLKFSFILFHFIYSFHVCKLYNFFHGLSIFPEFTGHLKSAQRV